ncbi:SDR family NAD(P)-dependent oxidoreductase [Azotobacter vinelandii]|uniref:SDR family NAD(P)-dependent oxidoreductase n=1 Tax=Azotobacter vinelandii TaxID=354 RepID=UPI0026665A24|nr:SDR family oxidoreductase [Azotobacter vinelandii]WKN23940.1 SDR family oxidoreductase [Azotobacter vinelandii]
MVMNNNNNGNWLGLDSAVCVVTGAAGGIGREIAAALVGQGARVVLLDRDEAGCAHLAERLSVGAAEPVQVLACDIADPESVRRAAALVESRFGGCDVLVNNASVLQPGGIEDIDLEKWNRVLSVNLNGYLLCSQAFGRSMLARGRGRIVHIASIAAHAPQTWSGAYSAAKAGVCMLSRQIASEWGARGVRSNVVCPGLIRTPLSAAFYADPQIERQRCAMTANGRIGEPGDIADAVLFLASPRADYVNGAELTVDGGLESMPMALIPRPGFESPVTVRQD